MLTDKMSYTVNNVNMVRNVAVMGIFFHEFEPKVRLVKELYLGARSRLP